MDDFETLVTRYADITGIPFTLLCDPQCRTPHIVEPRRHLVTIATAHGYTTDQIAAVLGLHRTSQWRAREHFTPTSETATLEGLL